MISKYAAIRNAIAPVMDLLPEADQEVLKLKLKTAMFFQIRGVENRLHYEIQDIRAFVEQRGIEIHFDPFETQ